MKRIPDEFIVATENTNVTVLINYIKKYRLINITKTWYTKPENFIDERDLKHIKNTVYKHFINDLKMINKIANHKEHFFDTMLTSYKNFNAPSKIFSFFKNQKKFNVSYCGFY